MTRGMRAAHSNTIAGAFLTEKSGGLVLIVPSDSFRLFAMADINHFGIFGGKHGVRFSAWKKYWQSTEVSAGSFYFQKAAGGARWYACVIDHPSPRHLIPLFQLGPSSNVFLYKKKPNAVVWISVVYMKS